MTPGDVPHAVLITDSTLDGFGAVLLREGHEPLAFGSRWPERRSDVNDAETHAIVLGLRRFEREILDLKNACAGKDRLRLLILVDNTSALHRVIRAGRGVYLRADGYAPAVWDIINAWGIRVRTEYVMSRDNVADAPSRGHVAVDPVLLKATMERAWGQPLPGSGTLAHKDVHGPAWGRRQVDVRPHVERVCDMPECFRVPSRACDIFASIREIRM